MAMNGDQMAGEVQTALEGAGAGTVLTSDFLKAFCGAVVAHIQNNADITAGLQATGTVTSGAGAGGAVETASELYHAGIK